MSGHVRIHRALVGHTAFRNDAEAMAFAWLVIKAAWKPVKLRYKGREVALDRGQVSVSIRDMAAALDRNKNWVSRVLQRMRERDMIKTTDGTASLVITVCNYNDYQLEPRIGGTVNGTVVGTDAGQTRDTEQGSELREGSKGSEAKASSPRTTFPAPDGVSKAIWADFLASPKRRKAGMSATAYAGVGKNLRQLAEHGFPPGEMISLAVERGWVTVKLEWVQNDRQQRTNSLRGNRPDPALDLYRAAVEAEQRENREAGSRTRAALPSYGPS